MALQTCGRRAPESGSAPSNVEHLGGRLDEHHNQTIALFQEILAPVRLGAARALRSGAARQAAIAAIGCASAGERFPSVIVRTGEAAIALRLATALSEIADEIEAEGGAK